MLKLYVELSLMVPYVKRRPEGRPRCYIYTWQIRQKNAELEPPDEVRRYGVFWTPKQPNPREKHYGSFSNTAREAKKPVYTRLARVNPACPGSPVVQDSSGWLNPDNLKRCVILFS
jgi:hypothetical protein